MKLFKMKKYAKDESGAVTVDWVVLTAALVIIGGIVISIIQRGLFNASSAIETKLNEQAGSLT
jgi:Flp pilus assembly pilin Flp